MGHDIPRSLEPIQARRDSFTVFSNLGHPGMRGGHDAVYTLFSGVTKDEAPLFPDKNISLDQAAARHFAPHTRYPSILTGLNGGSDFSWNAAGTCIKAISDPARLFATLFKEDRPAEKARQRVVISNEISVLDSLLDSAKGLQTRLGVEDRGRLDQYLSSVREVERELQRSRRWLESPKPKVQCENLSFEESRQIEKIPLLSKLLVLALQTNSTRVGTLEIPITFAVHELGIDTSYHALSHHGKRPTTLRQLQEVESFLMQQFAALLDGLEEARATDMKPLLEHCLVVLAGGLGDANTHLNRNLPVLLAGGGFKHRGHVVCPSTARERIPLSNLWLAILRWLGVPAEKFGKSTGAFEALELR